MFTLNSIANAVVISAALLTVCQGAKAQEVPYGVADKKKLDLVLQDAKTHLASHENDVNWLMAAGIASHQLASIKAAGASDDAVNYLKKATELAPDNVEILAYLGSAYAMAGRDSKFVVSKVSNVNKGLAALDKAVKKDSNNLLARFIRGKVTYGLPASFSRRDMAEADYLFLVEEFKKGIPVNPEWIAEAYFKLGEIAKEKKQKSAALEFYAQAKKAEPDSEWAQQANKAMK